MKPNIHPGFHRAMQASRQEEISRAAGRLVFVEATPGDGSTYRSVATFPYANKM
jgi:hypothetical protein